VDPESELSVDMGSVVVEPLLVESVLVEIVVNPSLPQYPPKNEHKTKENNNIKKRNNALFIIV